MGSQRTMAHALEQARADDAERTFAAAWKARPGKDVRRWART